MEEALEVNGMAQFLTSRFQSSSDISKFALPTAGWIESTKIIFLFPLAAWNTMACYVSSWHMPCYTENRFSGEQIPFSFHFVLSLLGSHTFDPCLCFTIYLSLGHTLPFPSPLIPKFRSRWWLKFHCLFLWHQNIVSLMKSLAWLSYYKALTFQSHQYNKASQHPIP